MLNFISFFQYAFYVLQMIFTFKKFHMNHQYFGVVLIDQFLACLQITYFTNIPREFILWILVAIFRVRHYSFHSFLHNDIAPVFFGNI